MSNEQYHSLDVLGIGGGIFAHHSDWKLLVVLVRRSQERKTSCNAQDSFSK